LVDTPGAVVENLDVFGFITVRAANVTIRNCQVRGRALSSPNANPNTGGGWIAQTGLVQCSDDAAGNLLVEHCTLINEHPRFWLDGIHANKPFTAYRCNIAQVVDGIDPRGSGWQIHGCYIHDLAFFDGSPDPSDPSNTDHASDSRFPGWTHNDCVQVSAATGGDMYGNNFQAYFSTDVGNWQTAVDNTTLASGRNFPNYNYAQAVILTPDRGSITGVTIRDNWFEGGEVLVKGTTGSYSGNSVSVTGNRFGLDQKPGYTGNPAQPNLVIDFVASRWTTTVDTSTNTYDTVASVPPALQGQAIGSESPGSTYQQWRIDMTNY
jgi:hypothetical protein